tara:strand:+ start:26252 stop:26476 length:225 start_codon:yes stop_codon:yes gene_type:complete
MSLPKKQNGQGLVIRCPFHFSPALTSEKRQAIVHSPQSQRHLGGTTLDKIQSTPISRLSFFFPEPCWLSKLSLT